MHWHVDISYLNLSGTFYYLCSVLDGYSRYLAHWERRESMTEAEVEIILQRAREQFPQVAPRVISDNGPHTLDRHACVGKDARIDHDDVGHGDERDQSRQQFAPRRGAIFFWFEKSFEQAILTGFGKKRRQYKPARMGRTVRDVRRGQEVEKRTGVPATCWHAGWRDQMRQT